LAWKDEGVSSEEIAKQLGRHRLSIARQVAKARDFPSLITPPCKKGSGRPWKKDKTLETILKRHVLKYPMMTAAEIQRSLAELRVVSEWTIQHTLQIDLKMPSRVAAVKPLLMEKMKSKRLKFSMTYQHFTAEDWSKVMYLDESTFKCIRASRAKVRRPEGASR
jgi:transposase